MKIIVQIKKIFFYSIFIIAITQITACKKDRTIITGDAFVYTPPPLGSVISSVHFWTRDIFPVNDSLHININSETKTLDESWGGGGNPSECCGYCGTIEFKMATGIYEWKTWRLGRDTARGTLTVTPNHCTMQQINY